MKADIKPYEHKTTKTIEVLGKELAAIRAGRANPGVLDKITVEYYGAPTPLNQVAAISTPDPRTLAVQPWDGSILRQIEKVIQVSDLGINPQNDGKVIRLVFPEMTEERRKELAKDVKKKGDQAKVAIRNVRRDANDSIKKLLKSSEISEDEQKQYEEKIQKMTDKFIEKVDKEIDVKSKEILTV